MLPYYAEHKKFGLGVVVQENHPHATALMAFEGTWPTLVAVLLADLKRVPPPVDTTLRAKVIGKRVSRALALVELEPLPLFVPARRRAR